MNAPIDHPFTGAELRDGGMKVAIEHADLVVENWSVRAAEALDLYLASHNTSFMTEEVRAFAHDILGLPVPASNRAWGSVIMAASHAKKIKHVGFRSVSNAKAHRTPASVWIKNSSQTVDGV